MDFDFEKVFDAYYAKICCFLNLYTKDKHVIEDIVQDVFCNLWANRYLLKTDNLKPYLYTAARNRILNHIRDIKLRKELLSKWISEEKELAEGFDCIDKAEFEEIIEAAVASLSPKCRKIFILSRYNKMSYNEIAVQEGISLKMVEKHVSTALKNIKYWIYAKMDR